MSKHTPGPWKAVFGEAYVVIDPDRGRVAMMMNLKGAHGLGGRRSGDEVAANAVLIAAAPDMAEALRALVEAASAPRDDWPRLVVDALGPARAALAKAGME